MSDKLTERTCALINKGRRIYLKRKDGWYLGQWACIQGGPDKAEWANIGGAMEIFDLKWAFALAKLYGCKVVTRKVK